MANVMRVTKSLDDRALPLKGSVESMEIGDLVFLEKRFQGNTSQISVRPASAGSTGSSAADGRYQFATNFAGVAMQRHDQNSYDKTGLRCVVDGEIEILLANSTGTATVATAPIAPGTKVGVAVTGAFVPIDDKVQVDGHHSVTIADNEAIGKVARLVKTGDAYVRVQIKSSQIFD